jgi:uncharacterized protein
MKIRILGFIVFFLIFLSIDGGVHYYFLNKVRAAYPLSFKSLIIIIFILLLLMFTPFIVAGLGKIGLESSARYIAYIGYMWMGILFLFFSISVLFDLYRLIAFIINHNRAFFSVFLTPKLQLWIPLITAVCISLYGIYEVTHIRLEKVTIKTSKLPAGMNQLRIAQISDVHLGLIVREYRLNKILEQVRNAKPDIFISTGDLVDADTVELGCFITALNSINPPYGKFAVTGNHEYYFGLKKAIEFTQRAGFTMLRGELAQVNDSLVIAGIDDPATHHDPAAVSISEHTLLANADHTKFVLFLKHQPSVKKDSIGLFDLQLSGHTHHGQIFPFRLFTRMFFSLSGGKLHQIQNSYIYVSRGSGTWGPPFRFLAPPEVTLIKLVRP